MKLKSDVHILNKRARHEYIIMDEYTAGIQLYGTEIKSIREGKASLVDSYCQMQGGELYVREMHIAEYRFGSYANHEAKRSRKLLLTKRELRKLDRATKETGKTIIPLELFINEKGLAKLTIALCQGKHSYDKWESLREADDKREMARAMKF
jgi:SsrA-binding protein